MATGAQLTTLAIAEQDWKELLEDLLPPQGRWSEDEYLVLTDHRNRLVEFTDGFLEALPMPTDKHQSVLGFLYVIFLQFVQPLGGKVQFSPMRCAFGRASIVSRISSSCSRQPIHGGRTGSGSAPTLRWRWSARTSRSATWSTSGVTTPKAASRSTGSSTRKPRPSPSFDCAVNPMRKQAFTGAESPRRRCCWGASRSP